MISHPKPGMVVQCWYRNGGLGGIMPFHGRLATVTIPCRARRLRNHGVRLSDGTFTIVPCGNLRKPPDDLRAPLPGQLGFDFEDGEEQRP